jgi:hypothetical protein
VLENGSRRRSTRSLQIAGGHEESKSKLGRQCGTTQKSVPFEHFLLIFTKYIFQQQYEFVHLVLLEILVVPKFSVTCGDFPSTFNILMVRFVHIFVTLLPDLCVLQAQNKKQFKNQYAQIQSVTEKDWKRAQAGVETSDGYLRIESRNKNMISGKS